MLAQRTEASAERSLQDRRTTEQVIAGVLEGNELLDGEIEELTAVLRIAAASGQATAPACEPGCSHCCKRLVEATAAEALSAVRFVESTFTPGRTAELRNRLAGYLSRTEGLRPAGLAASRVPCPFLENNLCSIYSARPFSCRGMTSIDRGACEKIAKGEAGPETRPALKAQLDLASAARTGLRLGLMFEYADSAMLDFAMAASIAMDNPQVGEMLLAGEDPFVAARIPYDLEPFDVGEISVRFKPMISQKAHGRQSGNLPREIIEQHRQFVEFSAMEGDFKSAVNAFSGPNAAHLMARMDVPRVARSEEEIEDSRHAFVQAMWDFKAAAFPPSEAFDALSIHQTMSLTYQGLDDLKIMGEHGKLVADIARRALPEFRSAPKRKRGGKLRVGYLSANLNRSNGGHWALGWLKNHGPDIETFCFLVGWRSDGITAQFKEHADHFYWLTRNVVENARFVRSLGLDVLIFTDIGLHARNTQYSAMRLAPIQCTAWGHPDTTGLPTIDYYLSSEAMEPEDGQQFYSEKLVRLPRLGLCYPRSSVEPSSLDRAHFGIPESEKLLLMGQANMKMLPQHDRIYAQICERVGSPLTLLESSSPGDAKVLKNRLAGAGVPTRWLPYQQVPDYLALMKLADVSLDTPMWSGGNSTIQALTLGTPVVTLPGPFMRSRHSFAMLNLANASGLVAKDMAGYIELACDFDRQREAMSRVNPDALYEDVAVVKELDEFLLSQF